MTSKEGQLAHNPNYNPSSQASEDIERKEGKDTECIKPLYMYLLLDRFTKAALVFVFPIFGLFPPPLPRLCGVPALISPLVTERNPVYHR